jgi:hypothetical protein
MPGIAIALAVATGEIPFEDTAQIIAIFWCPARPSVEITINNARDFAIGKRASMSL